jgi:hypothetical protein
MVARDGNPGRQRPTASFPPGVPTPGYHESPLAGLKVSVCWAYGRPSYNASVATLCGPFFEQNA